MYKILHEKSINFVWMQKWLWITLLCSFIGLENLQHHLNQSNVKLINGPFYNCLFVCQAFEQKWG